MSLEPQDSLNIVNLSKYPLTEVETDIISRGLSFCPNEDIGKFEAIKDIQLFAREIILKQLYDNNRKEGTQLKPQEIKAIDYLISLLEDNDPHLDLIDRIDLEHLL